MSFQSVSSLAHATVVEAAPATVSARFLVHGPSDPGLLPRLVEPFAKLGTVPSRVHASRESGDGSQMTVDLRLCEVAPRVAELVEAALRRVVGVSQLIAVVEAA
ncbi:MAG: hypothetical protein R3D44_05095 [Hyphomicrobiaceae bacterium]